MDGINPAAEAQARITARLTSTRVREPAPQRATESAAYEPIPESPPPEVLHALDRAAQVLQQLDAQRVHLHFEVGDDQKVRIKLVDGDGHVVRQIPQQKALDLLETGHGGLAVDALG